MCRPLWTKFEECNPIWSFDSNDLWIFLSLYLEKVDAVHFFPLQKVGLLDHGLHKLLFIQQNKFRIINI